VGAAYLIQAGDHSLLLDLGHGAFAGLASRLDPADLDVIFISHLHPDHFIDLVALRHYLRWEQPHGRRVRVLGPAGLADRIDALHAEPGFTAASLDVESIGPGSREIGPFVVDVGRVTHTDASFAFRVATEDRPSPALVYSGDCGRTEDLEALLRPGDVLLTEVSFGPGPAPPDAFHLDGPAVGGLAARADVGRVLLTHLQMGFDRAATIASVQAAYGGPVELVEPGYRTTV
jgi:ribonuclease BN (tRNA processing enzyme)